LRGGRGRASGAVQIFPCPSLPYLDLVHWRAGWGVLRAPALPPYPQIRSLSALPPSPQIQYKTYDIPRSKVQCLRAGEWLNDEAINFYMLLLQVRRQRPECGWEGSLSHWEARVRMGGLSLSCAS